MFIALGDWEGQTYGGETWPLIVDTRDAATFFDPKGDNVIAYGEQTWDSSTEGENMHPFVVVASESKYGVYFEGCTGSSMWLDNLKLVYDESELEE